MEVLEPINLLVAVAVCLLVFTVVFLVTAE